MTAPGPSPSHHDDGGIAAEVRRLEAQLEERGVVDGASLDALIDGFVTGATPAKGARVIARAWTDDGFRQRLLEDGNRALGELGLNVGGLASEVLFRVVENTEDTHNVLVCTLCSCYPVHLLGPSPSWYKSEAYRSRVVREPRTVLAEFGLHLPEDVHIEVWDSSAETRYMVLPRRPEGTEDDDEAQLASLVTRSGMIGTAAV